MLRNWVFTDIYKGILGEKKRTLELKCWINIKLIHVEQSNQTVTFGVIFSTG